MAEPYCGICRCSVTPDGTDVEVSVVEDPNGTTYYFHPHCWRDSDTPDWGDPA